MGDPMAPERFDLASGETTLDLPDCGGLVARQVCQSHSEIRGVIPQGLAENLVGHHSLATSASFRMRPLLTSQARVSMKKFLEK